MRKISPPPGFEPRIAQSVASRYTDWATRPTLFIWDTNCVFVCNAFTGTYAFKAIRLFNRLFGVLLSRKGGFDPCPVRVVCTVSKVAMGQVFIGILRLCPVRVFRRMLHTRPNLLAALTKRTKGEDSKPSKSSALPKIRVHCIEKYFICFRIWRFKGMYKRISFHQLVLQVKKFWMYRNTPAEYEVLVHPWSDTKASQPLHYRSSFY